MNLPQKKPPPFTHEDWASWEGRWELIEGVAYDMTPAPGLEHQRVAAELSLGIGNRLKARKGRGQDRDCEVLFAPLDLFLGEDILQPDLVVVCDPRKKNRRGIEGAPDLVVEILSPGSASRDAVRKRAIYQAAGVPEYLMVDPEERVGWLLRLEGGWYREVARVPWGGRLPLLGGRLAVTLG
jgi:Uma2 family endonuclease